MLAENVVLHVSALVELLVGTDNDSWVRGRLRGCRAHTPADVDAAVLICLERLTATAALPPAVADDAVRRLATMPLARHPVADLAATAWAARVGSGVADAVYLALADRLGAPLVATDPRLARSGANVEIVGR